MARCPAAKEYFKENSHHWSWAVQWLQKKVMRGEPSGYDVGIVEHVLSGKISQM